MRARRSQVSRNNLKFIYQHYDNMLNIQVWNRLTATNVQLPHALLFAGPRGVGKGELAEALAARLLCESRLAAHQPACGTCPSCLMFASASHPDFRMLQPDAAAESDAEEAATGEDGKKKASKQIRIQQIREIEKFFQVGGHRGGARVCLIEPAEAMNPVTANSLLKILEEPSSSFYFIMISHHWRRLLPTLLSRSRRVMFGHPSDAEAIQWLTERKLAEHTKWLPFFAHAPLELAEAAKSGRLGAIETLVTDLLNPVEPLAQAARWEPLIKTDSGMGMEDLVTTVQKWLHDLGREVVGLPARCFPHEPLSRLAPRISLPALLQAQQHVNQLRAFANHPLNPRLFLEDLCVRAFRPLTP